MRLKTVLFVCVVPLDDSSKASGLARVCVYRSPSDSESLQSIGLYSKAS